MEKQKLLVIAGPTASGKSSLAIRMAKRWNGEVISADSMQVYRRMDIGTAKVTPEEADGIPHHLIDVLEPTEEWNVALFQEQAGGGERNTLAGTEKELRAQILLQRTDLVQDGAGRQKEEIRRLGEAAAVADG